MNTGYLHEKELADRSDDDWKYGGLSAPSLIIIPPEQRELYLPEGELQNIGSEKYDCASRSPNNVWEALFTYHFQHDMNSDNKKWLRDNGYTKYDKVLFSDVYVSIGSGTTQQGNSLKAPIEYIRNHGLIPKWMLPQLSGWEENADPKRVTQEMKDLGDEFARRFILNYERVEEVHLPELLKEEMVCVAAYAWPEPVNGIYPRSSSQPNHAFMLFKGQYYAFDNYTDMSGSFIKHLAPDYDFVDTCYRLYLSKEDPNATPKAISLYQQLIQVLLKIRAIISGT